MTLPVVIPPFHFAANQFMVQVQVCLDPEHTTWCVEDLLAILDMEQTKCELNDVVYPMRMGPNYMLPSALEAMGTYWSAWDEELDENHRVHFTILDIPLFSLHAGARTCCPVPLDLWKQPQPGSSSSDISGHTSSTKH